MIIKNKLYRKLYLYAFLILTTSIFLTIISTAFLFHFARGNVFKEHFLGDIFVIKKYLNEIYEKNPNNIEKAISDLTKKLNWDIVYIKNDNSIHIEKEYIDTIKIEKYAFLKNKRFNFGIISFLDDNNQKKGFLILELRHPTNDNPIMARPVIFLNFAVLLFLGILLIPYSLYIIKPFNKLIESIKKVANGDFSSTIDVSPKSEFFELANSFNFMNKKIQEMISEKQRLIADVSHELRSPLTRMRMNMEVLAKDPEGRKKYIHKTIDEIEDLNKMIDNILDSSKLELSHELQLVKVNFVLFIKDHLENNKLSFEDNQIKITNIFDNDNIELLIDVDLMNRVMNNIFSNLLKYAPKNSEVIIKLEKSKDKILFTIIDQGEGVAEEDLDKIFEPFYRTDLSRNRKSGGAGLGLAIVKTIVNMHKGKIWAEKPINNKGFILKIEL
ncbi:MAG: ATP-binding protein [Candidatus Sericytochromatia bacterium]